MTSQQQFKVYPTKSVTIYCKQQYGRRQGMEHLKHSFEVIQQNNLYDLLYIYNLPYGRSVEDGLL